MKSRDLKMTKRAKQETRSEPEVIEESREASRRSLDRIEGEGERFLNVLLDIAEKYIPETHQKAVENLAQQTLRLFNQLNKSIEENAKKTVERLNIPTKKDLEEYNKEFNATAHRLRKNIDEQLKKGLRRFNIASKKELEEVAKEVKRLREEIDGQFKKTAPKKTAASKKPAQA